MSLETPAPLPLELALARILAMTPEERVEAMRADGAAWREAKVETKPRRKRAKKSR